ncbi:MAG TPA: tetratricopeptide repeat protein [Ktedonobacteraceae bacterium]
MAKKKTGQLSISQEAQAEAQRVFEQYHQLASNVRDSTERQAAEAALAEINDLTEAAQFALLKALGREKSVDAADLLLAINELSQQKSVRKEARRVLIQLASARVYPQWKPTVEQPPAIGVQLVDIPRRFYQGSMTDSLDEGGVYLTLAFEQGEDYREVQMFGFLLDFLHDGVKEALSQVMSKRSYDKTAARVNAESSVEILDCSLALGRRLIQDALATNKRTGTQPHFEFRRHLPLINQLILDAPDIEEEEEEEESEEAIPIQDLAPEDVIIAFVDAYFVGKFSTAYQLLADDSPLRDNLSQEMWVESRKAWFKEAHPESLEPNLLWERPAQKSGLWLPNIVSARRNTAGKTFEAGWSVEMDDAGEGASFPELPGASAVYSETKRHWFWVSYTLVQEEGQWRIQFMTDEAYEALNLPTEELDNKITEHDQAITEITRKQRPDAADALVYVQEITRHLLQAASYIDALLARSYDDLQLYVEASERMQLFGFAERSLVYLEQVAERFEQHRAVVLRSMGGLQRIRSQYYEDIGDIKRADRFLKLAEVSLQESLAIEDRFETHISMAEVLIDRDEGNDLDEARNHLLQAKAMLPPDSAADDAHIEMHLGEIAMEQGRAKEALEHYQRVVELEPDFASSWNDLAQAYKKLDNFEEADASLRRALALEPDNEDLIWNLGELYLDEQRYDDAIQIFEDAVEKNPTSASLNIFLASAYLESGDARQAEIFLDKAEKLDPDHIAVPTLRNALETFKKDRLPLGRRASKKVKRKHR